jgi:hypothetical protein
MHIVVFWNKYPISSLELVRHICFRLMIAKMKLICNLYTSPHFFCSLRNFEADVRWNKVITTIVLLNLSDSKFHVLTFFDTYFSKNAPVWFTVKQLAFCVSLTTITSKWNAYYIIKTVDAKQLAILWKTK